MSAERRVQSEECRALNGIRARVVPIPNSQPPVIANDLRALPKLAPFGTATLFSP